MAQEALNLQNSVWKICIDSVSPGNVDGRVVGLRLTEPMDFQGMGRLLLLLERLMDEQNFPQAYQRIRSFNKREGAVYGVPCLPEGAMDQAAVDAIEGSVTTFLLRVLSRQSATWQGNVDWLNGGKPQNFSSDLEFLSLVEERLQAE